MMQLHGIGMATLTIRATDEQGKSGLRALAPRRGGRHARDILEQSVLGSSHDEPFEDRAHRPASPSAVGHPKYEEFHLPAGLGSD